MSTNSICPHKNRCILITMRIGFFMFPIVLPMRCAHEVVEGFMDFMSLFRWAGGKAYGYLKVAESALLIVKDYGPLDLVNIDVTSPEARVKVKILTR